MAEVTKVNSNAQRYDYKKQSQPSEEFDLDSAGHEAAVEKNKKGKGSGPAYLLQLSPEAIAKLKETRDKES